MPEASHFSNVLREGFKAGMVSVLGKKFVGGQRILTILHDLNLF